MIIRFPDAPKGTKAGASKLDILKGRIRKTAGRLMNLLGLPGAINTVQIDDEVSGQTINVQVGDLFVRLTVNGRDYYFNRFTGRLDGTGSGCD